MSETEYETIVIGAGQAGLAAGYHLRRAGAEFLILDAEAHPGDHWRRRWDSLCLFTPARHDGLPGAPWTADPWNASRGHLPAKDEVAEYLSAYARRWDLPVRSGVTVTAVERDDDGAFRLQTSSADGSGSFRARNVIVATGATSVPFVPAAAETLRIPHLHSSGYRRPADVPGKHILVAGYGTSGAQIALELAADGRRVTIAGRPTPLIPAPFLAVAGDLWWLVLTRLLSRSTPAGRKAAPQATAHGAPLIGLPPRSLTAAGIRSMGRIAGVADGLPVTEDGPVEADAVLWCTGFRGDFGWIRVPGLEVDGRGYPVAPFGVPPGVPGLRFLGMPFQRAVSSTLLGGVGLDAEQVVRELLSSL